MFFRHSWNVTPEEAIAIQEELRHSVIRTGELSAISTIAGVDVGFEDNGTTTRAAVVVLRYPELEICETALYRLPVNFAYIPGLLSFREAPAILAALSQLSTPPQLLFCDGQGIAHPRRLGIASHIGLLTGIPSIGVAKSRLIGSHAQLAKEKNAIQPLIDRDETIGLVLRTKTNIRPLFISIGHLVSLETAMQWVLRCTTCYRLPEPIRAAHHLASG